LYDFVAYLKKYKDEGTNIELAAPRLLDLADARVLLVNMDNPVDVRKGVDEVVRVVNAVWGTALDETTVRDALKNGLPPC